MQLRDDACPPLPPLTPSPQPTVPRSLFQQWSCVFFVERWTLGGKAPGRWAGALRADNLLGPSARSLQAAGLDPFLGGRENKSSRGSSQDSRDGALKGWALAEASWATGKSRVCQMYSFNEPKM